MKGFYNVHPNENEEFDIVFELHPDFAKEEVPKEQQELYVEIESTNNVIKSLINTKQDIKKKYFKKLLSLAQAGLVSKAAQPSLALKSLRKLKEEMVSIEGQRIKNYYMKRLGITALVMGSVCAIIYILILMFFPYLHYLNMYFMVWIGAMIGTWISFGARKFKISFEQLSILEEDMMSIYIRLIYVAICAIILLLFLNTNIVSINIGKISINDISNKVELQLILGVICGLVESKLGINIYKKAVTIINNNV